MDVQIRVPTDDSQTLTAVPAVMRAVEASPPPMRGVARDICSGSRMLITRHSALQEEAAALRYLRSVDAGALIEPGNLVSNAAMLAGQFARSVQRKRATVVDTPGSAVRGLARLE